MQDGVAALALADPEQIFLPLAQQGAAQLAAGGRHRWAAKWTGGASTRVLRAAIDQRAHQPSGKRPDAAGFDRRHRAVCRPAGYGLGHLPCAGQCWRTARCRSTKWLARWAALIMTAIGLTVAIPAVLAYNGFNRVNRLTLAELDAFAHDLHAYLTQDKRSMGAGMSFGAFNHHRNPGPMADINVTPMVDVMLVLLVIFILAAPMLTNAVKLELPKRNAAPAPAGGRRDCWPSMAQGRFTGITIRSSACTGNAAGTGRQAGAATGTAAARRQGHPLRSGGAGDGRRAEQWTNKLGFVTDPKKEK
jgi:biopolymer transport protein ExbB